MTKAEFRDLLVSTFAAMDKLTATKGEEYAGSDDQLANFHRSGAEAGTRPEQAWLIFFNKHMDAIKHYVRHDRALSEPIEGRIDDAILYLILLKAMVRDNSPTGKKLPAPGSVRPIWPICPMRRHAACEEGCKLGDCRLEAKYKNLSSTVNVLSEGCTCKVTGGPGPAIRVANATCPLHGVHVPISRHGGKNDHEG
jgi:hypothetical protein